MTERICTVCGSSKPLDAFPKDRNGRQGRRARCKPCHCADAKKRYQADPTIRERYVASVRARKAVDPEGVRASAKAHYERHREVRLRDQRMYTAILRARRAGVFIERGITWQLLRERDGDQCCYCGCLMDFAPNIGRQYRADLATIDHVLPLSRGGGHTWDNIALACWACNTAKKNRTVEEWQETTRV